MSKDRFSRPDLPRTAPYHDMASLLNVASSRRHPDAPPGAAAEEASRAGPDFVTSGVRAAYQVIDTYMNQGQKVARQLGKLSYAPLRLGRRIPDFQARWLQLSNDLMADWFDLVGLYSEAVMSLGENGAEEGPAAPQGGAEQHPDASGSTLTVDYEVVSPRPARLHHEFFSHRATPDLATHGLRSLDPTLEPIDVGFEPVPGEDRVVIKIRIPADQPAGTYSGALLDATSADAVGTLSLRLG
ncbi:MAG: hypothetical protein RIC56_10360 [Pseudomonadales bacterium]